MHNMMASPYLPTAHVAIRLDYGRINNYICLDYVNIGRINNVFTNYTTSLIKLLGTVIIGCM